MTRVLWTFMLACSPIAATASLHVPYFFNQTPRLLFFSLDVFVWLLFEGDIYYAQSSRLCGYYSWAMSFQRNTVAQKNIQE